MTLGIMEHGEGNAAQLIQLEPLIHQVSGHSSLWVLDDDTVCKPLHGREAKFYKTLPPQIKVFTPEFRGTVKVLVQKTSEGVVVAALPPSADKDSYLKGSAIIAPVVSKNKSFSSSSRARRLSGRSKDKEEELPIALVESKVEAVATLPSRIPPLVPHTPPVTHNPWLQQCHQKYLNKLKQRDNIVIDCILLENLTYKYRVPNVLDLKMGTRQYGDDAPESKRRSQTRKALHTTTPTLGVRLAGMQVYNRDTKCYVCKNKYVGRELSVEGFQQTLRHFLHNGRRFRLDIVEQIISKLSELRKVVENLESFRFFTSSLLILYDSYDTKGSLKPKNKTSSKENVKQHEDKNQNCSDDGSGASKQQSPSTKVHNGEAVAISKNDNQEKCNCRKECVNSNRNNENRPSCEHCIGTEHDFKNSRNNSNHCIVNAGYPQSSRNSLESSSVLSSSSTLAWSKNLPSVHNSDPMHQNAETNGKKSTSKDKHVLDEGSSSKEPTSIFSEHNKISKKEETTSTHNLDSSFSSVDGSPQQSNRTKVDVRLIDFAHSTHGTMGDSHIYSGPDEGIILGLKSLIEIFTQIKTEYAK